MYRVNWRTSTVVSTTTVTVVDEDGNDVDMVEAEVSGIGELTDAASLWRLRIRSKIVDPSFWTTAYVYTYPIDALFTGEPDQQVKWPSLPRRLPDEWAVRLQSVQPGKRDPADARPGHYPISGGLSVMDVTDAIGLWDFSREVGQVQRLSTSTGRPALGRMLCDDPKDDPALQSGPIPQTRNTHRMCATRRPP